MNGSREVKLFRNGRNQAVRIPRDLELPGNVAILRRDGERRVIESPPAPGPNARLLAFLASSTPLADDDAFPDIVDSPPGPIDL